MSPAEKIGAAIQRLEQLKADSTPGWWEVEDEAWDGVGRWEVLAHTANHAEFVTSDGDGIGSLNNYANADLIVTLHRTIDAQLRILHDGRKVLATPGYVEEYGEFVGSILRHELLIADAILGESS